MTRGDSWARRARDEGFRSRAAYKLKQLDAEHDLFEPGQTVIDLGGAPGGWMQVAAEAVGPTGTVIGVDRRSIDPIDDSDATIETLQCDLTEDDASDSIEAIIDGSADVVISDMAPDMSGQYDLDHARSIHLAEMARSVALDLLPSGGTFVVKVFDGRDLASFRENLAADFEYVAASHPPASRDSSSEVYLVAKGRLTAPVREGDRVTVTIEAIGEEGDGIASIDGYRIFVPDTAVDDQVAIVIEDVKPSFAFATRVD